MENIKTQTQEKSVYSNKPKTQQMFRNQKELMEENYYYLQNSNDQKTPALELSEISTPEKNKKNVQFQYKELQLQQNLDYKDFHFKASAFDQPLLESPVNSKQNEKLSSQKLNLYSKQGLQEEVDIDQLSISQKIQHKQWAVRQNGFQLMQKQFNDLTMSQSQLTQDCAQIFSSNLMTFLEESNLSVTHEILKCTKAFLLSTKFNLDAIQFQKIVELSHTLQLKIKTIESIIQLVCKKNVNFILELVKFFSHKNTKLSQFCIKQAQTAVQQIEQANQKLQPVFQELIYSLKENLKHSQRVIRETTLSCLTTLFSRILDSSEMILNLFQDGQLRQALIKEIEQCLVKQQKQNPLIFVFEEQTDKKQSQKQEQQNTWQVLKNQEKQSQGNNLIGMENQYIELSTLISQDFLQISNTNDPKVKKKILESLNQSLEAPGVFIDQSNKKLIYVQVLTLLGTLLEDPNILVYQEAIKTLNILAQIYRKFMQENSQWLCLIILEKYKERKKTFLMMIDETLNNLIKCECVSIEKISEILLEKAISSQNIQIREKCMIFWYGLLESLNRCSVDTMLGDTGQDETNQLAKIQQKLQKKLTSFIQKIQEQPAYVVVKETALKIQNLLQGVENFSPQTPQKNLKSPRRSRPSTPNQQEQKQTSYQIQNEYVLPDTQELSEQHRDILEKIVQEINETQLLNQQDLIYYLDSQSAEIINQIKVYILQCLLYHFNQFPSKSLHMIVPNLLQILTKVLLKSFETNSQELQIALKLLLQTLGLVPGGIQNEHIKVIEQCLDQLFMINEQFQLIFLIKQTLEQILSGNSKLNEEQIHQSCKRSLT